VKIRIVDKHGHEFILTDPEVGESRRGPFFSARYQMIDKIGPWPENEGDFWLKDLVLIEPVDEQLEMQLQEAA
jgi:hypothetical protein